MPGQLQNSRGDIASYKKARGVKSVMNFGGVAKADAAKFQRGDVVKVMKSVAKSLGGDLIKNTYYLIQNIRSGIPGSSTAWLFDVVPATRIDFNNKKTSEVKRRDILGEHEKVGLMSGLLDKRSVHALDQQHALCDQNDVSANNCRLPRLKNDVGERAKREEFVSLGLSGGSLMYGCDKKGIKDMEEENTDFEMAEDPTSVGARARNFAVSVLKPGSDSATRNLIIIVLVVLGAYLFATQTKRGKKVVKALLN